MKKLLIAVVVIIIVIVLAKSGAPKDVPNAKISDSETMQNSDTNEEVILVENLSEKIDNLDPTKLSFNFIGFGPGKSHIGKFNNYTMKNLEVSGNTITSGQIVFDLTSVTTGIETLDTHLCKEEFFNCDEYPEGIFELKNISKIDNNTLKVTGLLSLRGVTKEISFDLKKEGTKFNADFLINTEPFGMNVILADKDVQIQFEITL